MDKQQALLQEDKRNAKQEEGQNVLNDVYQKKEYNEISKNLI